MKKRKNLNRRRYLLLDKTLKKEIILYSIIVVILVVISILNSFFWKIEPKTKQSETRQIQQLEVNNITYNVPYEERWLDGGDL